MGLVGRHLALDVSEKEGARVTYTGVFSCCPRLKKTIFREGITLSEIQKVRSRQGDFFLLFLSFFCYFSLAVVCLVNTRWKRTRRWVPTESERPKA
jgi:hypothetical protein